MGFRFRKSFKIAPGVKLNLNKKSAGITFGGKGAHFTMNTKGKNTTSVGVPGTGLYYTSTSGGGSTGSGGGSNGGGNHYGNNYNMPTGGNYGGGNNYNNNFTPPQKTQKNYIAITILLLIFFFPLGLYFMWAKTNWNKAVKIVISAFYALLFIIAAVQSVSDSKLPASSSGIQQIEIEDTTVRLDYDDPLNMTKTIDVHYLQNYTTDILNSDFIFKFSDDSIASANVMFLSDSDFSVNLTAYKPGTTTMYIQTIDGKIKSNEITIEVLGTPIEETTEPETTQPETTEQETSTAPETTETETQTKESTTKDTSKTVYITPSGSKYHYSQSCAGDNAIKTTLNQVKDTCEPCKKCAQ